MMQIDNSDLEIVTGGNCGFLEIIKKYFFYNNAVS